MLSSELEFCLNEAFQQARAKRHEDMTGEHLLPAAGGVVDGSSRAGDAERRAEDDEAGAQLVAPELAADAGQQAPPVVRHVRSFGRAS